MANGIRPIDEKVKSVNRALRFSLLQFSQHHFHGTRDGRSPRWCAGLAEGQHIIHFGGQNHMMTRSYPPITSSSRSPPTDVSAKLTPSCWPLSATARATYMPTPSSVRIGLPKPSTNVFGLDVGSCGYWRLAYLYSTCHPPTFSLSRSSPRRPCTPVSWRWDRARRGSARWPRPQRSGRG